MSETAPYRLVTRPDFDGVCCGALLEEEGLVSDVLFVHPREIQHGEVEIGPNDILANLPHHPNAHLVFDHHISEIARVGDGVTNHVIDGTAPSAARVIYEYYGGGSHFTEIDPEMIEAVDIADSAAFTMEDVLIPEDWLLLHFIVDPRTGLEDFKTFEVPRDVMMRALITYCRHTPISEIIEHPDVSERTETYLYYNEFAELQLVRCSEMRGDVVITDYRKEEPTYPVNRFMVYGIYPDATNSISLRPGLHDGMTEIAAGRSILNRASHVNLGAIMLKHGGGGHAAAATCQVPDDKVAETVEAILADIGAGVTAG